MLLNLPRTKQYLKLLRHYAMLMLPLAILQPIPANAADHALLIGVGNYHDTKIPSLSGIDFDIEMMQEVSSLLGFAPNNIRILKNADATSTAIRQAFTDWLINATQPGDRVLFYFSGHGSQIPDTNGDEADGNDEVLLAYDTKLVVRHSQETLNNVLVDDEIHELITKMLGRKLIMLVDACHSGSSFRGITLTQHLGKTRVQSKFFDYAGRMPTSARGVRIRNNITDNAGASTSMQYAVLAAANDDEEALNSPNGGFFTIGIYRTIRAQAQSNHGALTMAMLQQRVTAYLSIELSQQRMFNPQLSGDPGLITAPLPVTAAPIGQGAQWQRLESLYQEASNHFTITPNQTQHHVNRDYLELTLNIPTSGGYLNILNVGPDDEVTILFPNEYQPSNKVAAGPLLIPGPRALFRIGVPGPTGSNLIVAFVTPQPVNLHQTGFQANTEDVFRNLMPAGANELQRAVTYRGSYNVERVNPSIWSAKVLTEVVP
ncbi:hypothetical protein TI04_06825 [Achromatium sp. WMS2]|nr:hypothetical protein TI04_06825 [Achromatium sp. WMS2]